MSVDSLVKAVCQDFPSDRRVVEAVNREKWFTIDVHNKILYVPIQKVLRGNLDSLDKFAEAVNAFAIKDEWADDAWDSDNFTELDDNDDPDKARLMLQMLIDLGVEYMAVDIEARHTGWNGNKLLAIGIAISETESLTFTALTDFILVMFQQLFNRRDVKFIWQNGKFDSGRLKFMNGLEVPVDEDTMLLHYIGINEKRGTHGLKDLGQLYLQAPAWEDELNGFKAQYCRDHKILLEEFTYDLIPRKVLIKYLHKDCVATYRLLFVFKKLARPESEFMYDKLLKASIAYRNVELNGIMIDQDYLEDLDFELEGKIKEATVMMEEASDRLWNPAQYVKDSGAKSMPKDKHVNIKSPKQLKWILEKAVGHKISGTAADILEGLAEEVEGEDNFVHALLRLRKLNKQMDTYVTGLRNVLCSDGRVRGTFNLHGTETGRLSSSKPNMQNIPRDKTIKNLFIASPGYALVELDYSQAELRVLAQLSGDPFMQQVYIDGKDMHDAVAEKMFGPDFDSEQRNLAKTINFGIAYGRGPDSLMDSFSITYSEAKKLIDDWFRPMPLVKQFIKNKRKEPFNGIPCTTVFGRLRHFVITNDNRNHIENESINTPIQATASDCTLMSVIEIDKQIRLQGIDAGVINNVHDSILIEVRDTPEDIAAIVELGKRTMAEIPKKYIPDVVVPFKADVKVGYKWGDLEKWN